MQKKTKKHLYTSRRGKLHWFCSLISTYIMPKTSPKQKNLWTEQHEAFCLENKIPHAAQRLWQWLLWESKLTEEVEPDLTDFNAWIEETRGKKYANQYLKKMFELLKKLGVIGVLKKFCWKVYRVVIRPLEWVQPLKKKKLQNGNPSYKTEASNDCNEAVASLQQQHSDLKRNQETLAENDINFDTKEKEVLNRPNWEIRASLALLAIRSERKIIENPEGFIRDCLRFRWWESNRNRYAIIFKVSDYEPIDDVSGVTLDTLFAELDALQQKTL